MSRGACADVEAEADAALKYIISLLPRLRRNADHTSAPTDAQAALEPDPLERVWRGGCPDA